ncbi:MAG: OmpA family protein [Saprospiraceae bacterium]
MRKQILILAACACVAVPLASQNTEFRNAIHAKVNVVDYGSLYNNTARVSQGFEVGYFRNVAPFLNVGLPVKMALAKLPNKTDNTVTASLDLVFQLGAQNPLRQVSPYVFAGAGLFTEALDSSDVHFPFGAGLNFRISKYAYVNVQGEFRKAMNDNRDNLQLGVGFVYLLHKSEIVPPPPPPPADTDKDSIPDIADRCPELPGPASALGCPDKDGDGLGDQEDKCPDQKGSLETEGCPDTDGDGVPDKDDLCPNAPGTVKGCPDRDKDGTADADDECPDTPGRWNGCPDTDFDGVPDKDDLCPTDPGNIANKGCPQPKDSDGDGTFDNNDKCPDVPGPLFGCPDKDGDRVADKDDPCPDTPGDLNGCPDQDKDGVADKDDGCPTVAGKIKGCPDTDGDGVADNMDKCPTSPGTGADGCPEIKQEVKEKLAFATKAVQFESGKAVLKMQSYAVLDELFNILKQYPDYKLAISGHTDDQGDEEKNLALSTARAKACVDYLVFRGVKENRLRYAGFGEMRPIAANSTPAGREMNRRVEFELVVD